MSLCFMGKLGSCDLFSESCLQKEEPMTLPMTGHMTQEELKAEMSSPDDGGAVSAMDTSAESDIDGMLSGGEWGTLHHAALSDNGALP